MMRLPRGRVKLDVFMQGLNVTIYGLGIVFLALLVLMVTIMILSKLFEVTTGKEVFTAASASAPRASAPVAVAPTAAPSLAAAPPAAPQVTEEAATVEEEVVVGGEVVGQVTAPLPGKILSISVKAGDRVQKGDEVCVIEAMKMGNSIKSEHDGVVGEVLVTPGESVTFGAPLVTISSVAETRVVRRVVPAAAQASAPVPAAAPVAAAAPPAPSSFKLGAPGQQHSVEVTPGPAGSIAVNIDGKSIQVQRDQTDPRKYVIDGKTHTVEVKESKGGIVTVLVDGAERKLDLSGASIAATAAATAPLFGAGSFKMALGAVQHQIEIKDATGPNATVVVDGVAFKIERGKANPKAFVVNGKPFVVEVRDRNGSRADVLIDGEPRTVQLVDVKAAPAPVASPAQQPAPAPAPSPAPRPAPVAAAAPVPDPAPAATPAASRPSGGGEQVTAPLPGKIISVAVKVGEVVRKGDELCVIEAMKMGNSIKAQRDGTIQDVLVSPGDSVAFGAPLLVMG